MLFITPVATFFKTFFVSLFRKNPKVAQIIKFGDSNSLAGSNFDKSKDVKFIAHGWTDNGNTGVYSATLRDGNTEYISNLHLHFNLFFDLWEYSKLLGAISRE